MSKRSHKDVFLIVYPDAIKEEGRFPLSSLRSFALDYFSDFSFIHILPFFESTSDDGFSVSDYYKVDPFLGSWEDIEMISRSFSLVFDGVLNHTSSDHYWFKRALEGDSKFEGFYIKKNDLPEDDVFRPRDTPLFTKYKEEHYWTTFSSDQIDLNYYNPHVICSAKDVLRFYKEKGAQLIRLDAIAYFFKEPLSDLRKNSRAVCLLRELKEELGDIFVSEVNMETDIIDNFRKESLAYNFALPALVLYAFLSQDTRPLLKHLQSSHENDLNFLASHDGVALCAAKEYLGKEGTDLLCRLGEVSYGEEEPYEVNVNYFDALERSVEKMLCAHSLLLSLKGSPAVYYHSLLGSSGKKNPSFSRDVNREKLHRKRLEEELSFSPRKDLYEGICFMIKERKKHDCFCPHSRQEAYTENGLLVVLRNGMACIHNITPYTVRIKKRFDCLSRSFVDSVAPYGFLWTYDK